MYSGTKQWEQKQPLPGSKYFTEKGNVDYRFIEIDRL